MPSLPADRLSTHATAPRRLSGLRGAPQLLIAGLAATLIGLTLCVYLVRVETRTHEATRAALSARDARSIAQLDGWLDQRHAQILAWANRPETQALARALVSLDTPSAADLNEHPLQRDYRRLFAAALGEEGLQGYFIVSTSGRSLASSRAENTGTQNLLWRETDFFDQARARGIAVSPLMTSDVVLQNGGVSLDGRPLTLFVGVPITLEGSPEPAAYFMLRIPPVSLFAAQGQARDALGANSYLVDRQGRLHADRAWLGLDFAALGVSSEPFRGRNYLFARDPQRNLLTDPGATADRATLPLTRSAQGIHDGVDGMSLLPYRDHRGVDVIGVWGWDARLGLGVVTEMPVAEAYAAIERSRFRVLVAVVLFALAAIGALVFTLLRSHRRLNGALVDAQAASLAKGSFLANMSHEIRTPMNAIIGLTHLSARETTDPLQRERLGKIGSAAHHLLQLINDVLDLSKVEAGKLTLEDEDFALDSLLARSFELVSGMARDKGLELVLDIDHLPARLRGDTTRLSQMLINLLSNGVKFTHAGFVRLRGEIVERHEGRLCVRFEVQDTGEGIALQRLGELFSAFQQADASTTRRHGGTGLGLALTRQLALAMGGAVGVASVLGQGSRFWFTAWLGEADEAADPAAPQTLHGLRALLVDDLPEALSAIGDRLQSLGLLVDGVADGPAALDRVKLTESSGEAYDVMLVDWRMTPIDGIETMRRVRAMLGGLTPPSVLVTAADDATIRELARAAGFDDVLVKPITGSALHDSLARALRRQRGGRGAPAAGRSPAPSAVAEPLEDEQRLLAGHAGQRVLVAEDNALNREVAEELLRAAGLVVESAEDGAAALRLVLSRPYDLVLMDMQMPAMDGLQATRAIRMHLGPALPIVAMTANAFAEDRLACIDAGMNDHVGKPVDPKILYATLLRWLPATVAVAAEPAPAARPHAFDADPPATAARPTLIPVAKEIAMAAPMPPVPIPFNPPADEARLQRIDAVDGLDLWVGMRNMAGKLSLLERALARFVETYRGGQPGLLEPDSPLRHESWMAICHSVRGASSTIGALQLAREAERLEDASSDHAYSPALALQAAQLHHALVAMADEINAAIHPGEPVGAEAGRPYAANAQRATG